MSNLIQRILSSIVFVLLILGPLFLDERIAFIVYAILGGFTLNEVLNLTVKTGSTPQKPTSFLLYALLVLGIYSALFLNIAGLTVYLSSSIGIVALYGIIKEVFRINNQPAESISVSIFSPLFVAASFLGIMYFFVYRDDLPSLWLTISVFVLIWVNDSAAYLLGRKIGKRKLNQRLSPNKTIEGSASGMITSLIAAALLAQVDGMPSTDIMLGFGLVIVASGSLGDLYESRLKRAAGVKDSGKFLPGHGGFFDRFDAMMLAVPAAILFFELIQPKH